MSFFDDDFIEDEDFYDYNQHVNVFKRTWTTKDEREIKIKDLTNNHLINIIKMYKEEYQEPHFLLLQEYYIRIDNNIIKEI